MSNSIVMIFSIAISNKNFTSSYAKLNFLASMLSNSIILNLPFDILNCLSCNK